MAELIKIECTDLLGYHKDIYDYEATLQCNTE